MKRILSSLVFLSLVSSTVSQAAIPVTRYDAYLTEVPQRFAAQGFYWGFLLGVNSAYNSNTHPRVVDDPNDTIFNINGQLLPGMTIDYKAGEFAGLTGGFRIYCFRFEAELDYRRNKWKKLTDAFVLEETNTGPVITTIPDILNQGDTVLGSFMGNIIWDFYWTSGWMWSIGLGAGYSVAFFDGSITDATDITGAPIELEFNGAKGAFAGQFIFGFAYRWSPCFETGLTYRLFARQGSSFNSRGTFVDNWTIEFAPKYVSNTLTLEFRFF